MASQLEPKLQLPHPEPDAIRHLPDDAFAFQTKAFLSQEGWVVDENYLAHVTEQVVWPAADTAVWPDLPKSLGVSSASCRLGGRAVPSSLTAHS